MKNLSIFLIFILGGFSLYAQDDFNDFERKVTESDIAVIGKVIEKESFWNPEHTRIFTSNKIQVLGKIKGEVPSIIEIITNGGDTGESFHLWSHEPAIMLDAKGYFFLQADRSGTIRSNVIYRLSQQENFISLPRIETENSPTFVSDKIVEFGFDNIQIQQVNLLSFDLLIKTNAQGVGLEFGYGDILAEYSQEVFGLNVYANDRLGVTKEVVIQNPAYGLITQDFTESVFRSVISGGCGGTTGAVTSIPLTTVFQKLLTVEMEIQDLTALGTISLDEFQMNGNINYYDPQTGNCLPFDSIIYPDPFEANVLCNIFSFSSDFDPTPNVAPFTAAGGTDNILTIIGNGFGGNPGVVEFQNADDPGGALVPTEIVDFDPALGSSWAGGQIQVRIPSAPVPAGSGVFQVTTANNMVCISPAPLEISYSALNFRDGGSNAVQVHLADSPSDNGQFEFRLEDDIDANMDALNATSTAICDWHRATDINWTTGPIYNNDAGGVELSPAIDNVNHIFLAPAAAFNGNAGASMRTIIGGARIQSCQELSGGTTTTTTPIAFTTDIDIAVRENLNLMIPPAPGGWNFNMMNPPAANQLDYMSIILHELGHVHGLDHALDNNVLMIDKIMHPTTALGIAGANIHANDEAGGIYILANSQAVLTGPNALGCPIPVGVGVVPALCLVNSTDETESLGIGTIGVFPNPFLNSLSLNVYLNEGHNISITLHDVLGKSISKTDYGQLNSREHTISLPIDPEIPSGVYFITVEIDTTLRIFKVIKI